MKDEMDPELLDEDVRRMEHEEPPRPHPGLKYHAIRPVLSDRQYSDLKKCYLLPEHGAKNIEPNTVYFDPGRKQIKFLLLKSVLVDSYIRAKLALEGATWGPAARESTTGQPHPRKITYGWYPQRPGHVAGHGFDSVRSEATLSQPALAHGLRPMVRAMNDLLAEYLPTYYPTALREAMKAVRREDEREEEYFDRVPKSPLPHGPDPVGIVRGIDPWGKTPDISIYTLWGTVFSTLELNNHILFKAHEDAYNVDGTLVCISAIGTWVGGRLILPRYGYGADLDPTDLLICDNHFELHGNLGPLVGQRFSVVAFLHSNVLDYANRDGQWAPKTENSSNGARA
jgi:hypothetical protein